MKKVMKRILSVMLVVVMTIGASPLSGFVGLELSDLFTFASAVEETGSTISGTIGDNLIWLIDKPSKTLTIDCIGDMPSVDYGNTPWYLYRNHFNSVIINDGCTSISEYAFYECDNILSVQIPESVTYIGNYVFGYCDGLSSVTLPSRLTYINHRVFENCTNLTTVLIPDGVTSISDSAFYNCYNLENVEIPDAVTFIGGHAFYNCRKLTSITISENVNTIEYGAFANCINIKSVTIPASVMNIGNEAFTSPIQIICYKNSPAHTFAERNSIAYWLLDDETQEKTISGTVGTKLRWSIDRKERKLTIDNQGSMVSFASDDAPWKQYKQYINSVKVNDGCTNISQNAFNGCSYIVSVDLPDTIETIDDNAFNDCRALKNITIPKNTTSIGYDAFNYCTSLKNVYNLENVTSIGGYAFGNCNNLTSVEFNSTDLYIGYGAFHSCGSLTEVSFDCSDLRIDSDAFGYCDALTSVDIQCSNLTLGSSAFYNCKSLATVSIDCDVSDENYSYISSDAFYGCNNLETATISEGVDAIHDRAFANCPKLSKITIYNKNCSISPNAISIYATIYGYSGSTAEEFANNYGYNFVPLDIPCEHTYSNDCDDSCDICGETRETAGHDYGDWTVLHEPTCNAQGVKTQTCSVCGGINEEYIPTVEHEWSEWFVTKEAACNKSGLKERTCTICGDIEKEIVGITDHTDENNDGICEVCNKQFEYKYPMNGICGPGLTWVLDDEGVLTISGNGEMFDFNGSDFVEVKDMSGIEPPSYDETTTSTNYWQTTTTTRTAGGPNFDVPDDPRLEERIATTAVATERATTIATTAVADEPIYNTTGSSGNQHIPHPDEYVPTTTSRYPIATGTVIYYPTTARPTTAKQTTTGKATTTRRPATTTMHYYPDTTTMVASDYPTVKETTTLRYSEISSKYPINTNPGYSDNGNSSGIIRVYRWNLHFDKIKKVVIEEGVTSIGNNAFADCQNLVSVVMPDSLKEIGEYAFSGCSGLTEIEIPVNVSYINHCAFLDCSALETLNFNADYCGSIYYTAFNNCNIKTLNIGANVNVLPKIETVESVTFAEGATYVPDNAFSDCYNLKSVSLSDTIETIGYRAFENCSSLESIDIPNSVTYIGDYAFRYCASLTTVTTPSEYCYIGNYAFVECYNLTTLNLNTSEGVNYNAFNGAPVKTLNIGAEVTYIPKFYDVETVTFAEGATYVPDYAFSDCYNLRTVNLPESITTIGHGAFSYCHSLSEINIPDNLGYIGMEAFYSCDALTEITIPEEIYEINYNAFAYCGNLETLTINAKNCYLSDGVFYMCPIKTLNVGAGVNYFPNFRSLETVTFADGATQVPDNAFSNCTQLTSVTLPDSIETIGYRAFDYCTSLESIRLPRNLWVIGEKAFYSCYNLKTADLPASVNIIGNYAFDNCQSLKEINIPDAVTYIGQYAFYACTSVTSVTVPENVHTLGQAAFGNCIALESVEYNAIECSTEPYYYDYSVFYGCSNISSVKIGPNVTRIIEGLMKDKPNITSVEIPSSVKEIGREAFKGTSLSAVELPNGLEIIGVNAFSDITTATTINIPESVLLIQAHAFANMTALEKINFNAADANVYTYDYWGGYYGEIFANSGIGSDGITVVFGESVENIPAYLFEVGSETAFPNIKNVVIGSNVKTIGDYAFYHCCAIENIDFGTGVEVIGEYAFDGCFNIKSLEFPESLKTISFCAFYSCNGLTEITIPENVEEIAVNAFARCSSVGTVNFNATNCTLGYDKDFNCGVFDLCNNLKTVRIGSEVESIPAYAFTGAENLEKVYVPDIAIDISPYAFEGCGKVAIVCKNGSYANVYAVQNNIKYILEDNVIKTAFEIKNGMLLGYSGTAQNVVLPSDINSVGIDAFKNNNVVKSIEIPYNISKIYSGAFENCRNLEKVIIPFTVTDIASSVFTGTKVTIYCYYNSYAYNYAVANGISYELITVTFSTSSVNIVEGETISVSAVPSVTLASGVPLVWKSENPAVASVDSTGKIVGNTVGNTTVGIYALDGNLLDSCAVTVGEKIDVEFEEPSTDTLKYGEKLILHINTSELPEGASVKWTTSDGGVLKISNENVKCSTHGNCMTCTVESVGNGSAEIKATVVDENGDPVVQNGEEISVSYKITSKACLWNKIVAFFKKIFGLAKTIPQFYKGIY